jgi:hypothetical protein
MEFYSGWPYISNGMAAAKSCIIKIMKSKMEQKIPRLVQLACALEACAPKPGNVNRYHDFCDTSLEDFLLSAAALGSAFENAAQAGVGKIILDAAESTRDWVRSNEPGHDAAVCPLAKPGLDAERTGEVSSGLCRF